MKVYVAQAIDRPSKNDSDLAETILADVVLACKRGTICLFRPGKAFHLLDENTDPSKPEYDDHVLEHEDAVLYLVSVNMYALNQADAVLVIHVSGVESWGTVLEMERTTKPVVFLSVDGLELCSQPIYLQHLVMNRSIRYCRNAREAAEALMEWRPISDEDRLW